MLPFLSKIFFSLKSFWHQYQPFIKIFIGFSLLGILFWRIPLPENLFSIVGNNLEWVGLAVFLGFLGHALSSLKLTILLRSMGTDISFLKVLKAYYIGTFFNNFLPTSIGGDVVKLQKIRSDGVNGYIASAGIVMERATGLSTAIALMGFVCLFGKGFLNSLQLSEARFFIATLCFLVLIFSWSIYFLGGKKISNKIKASDNLVLVKFGQFLESLNLIAHQERKLFLAFCVSLFFYLDFGILILVAGRTFGQKIPLLSAIQMLPFVALISSVPISVGALGLVEGTVTFGLIAIGIDPSLAFSIAILIRLNQWGHSAIGGILCVLHFPESK